MRFSQSSPLKKLAASNTPISPAFGQQFSAPLTSLRELALEGTKISSDGLKHFVQSCPLLKTVKVGGAGELNLQNLAPLKYLVNLSCSGSALTEEGVKSLAAIPSLQRLTWTAPVNDEIAARVTSLGSQLQTLEIVLSDDGSPDGEQILTAHNQLGELRLWTTAKGELIRTYRPGERDIPLALKDRFQQFDYLDWSIDQPEIFSNSYFKMALDSGKCESWYWHMFHGGHATRHTLSPNRAYRLVHNDAGFTGFAEQPFAEFTSLGQIAITSWWMPDNRRVLLDKGWSPPAGHDLATGRRLGTLFPVALSNHWLCIGPTGHYRCGAVDQPGDGTDPQALSAVEEFLVYVAQTEDGSQITYTPKEFREKYGWKNDPTKATLLDFPRQ